MALQHSTFADMMSGAPRTMGNMSLTAAVNEKQKLQAEMVAGIAGEAMRSKALLAAEQLRAKNANELLQTRIDFEREILDDREDSDKKLLGIQLLAGLGGTAANATNRFAGQIFGSGVQPTVQDGGNALLGGLKFNNNVFGELSNFAATTNQWNSGIREAGQKGVEGYWNS